MRLSDFLSNVGRAVAYYPGLARLLGGVKHAIFVAQLVYWRTRGYGVDGWIYKSVDEIREETGLSYKEQRQVRKDLVPVGLIEERYAREEHRLYFRINLDRLDELWNIAVAAAGGAEQALGEADRLSSGAPREGASAHRAYAQREDATCPKGRCHLPKSHFDNKEEITTESTQRETTMGGGDVQAEADKLPEPTRADAERLYAEVELPLLWTEALCESLIAYLRQIGRIAPAGLDVYAVALDCLRRALPYTPNDPFTYALKIATNDRFKAEREPAAAGPASQGTATPRKLSWTERRKREIAAVLKSWSEKKP